MLGESKEKGKGKKERRKGLRASSKLEMSYI
jgi:hypothetical protein